MQQERFRDYGQGLRKGLSQSLPSTPEGTSSASILGVLPELTQVEGIMLFMSMTCASSVAKKSSTWRIVGGRVTELKDGHT